MESLAKFLAMRKNVNSIYMWAVCVMKLLVLSSAICTLINASESDLDDPLENLTPSTQTPATPHKPTQTTSTPTNSANSSTHTTPDNGANFGSPHLPQTLNPQTPSQAPSKTPESSSANSATTNPNTFANKPITKPAEKPATKPSVDSSEQDRIVAEIGRMDDFAIVQQRFPWIKSVGLAMVSFDDGSFRSGFGLLLPEQMFLTSAELAHNAHAYPKNILLKMRDESAGHLICVAELRLKALDKVAGLALFEVSGYTDDHCNLRSQSYYHSKILDQFYDITKHKRCATTDEFYAVTTTFNNPNISVLTLKDKNSVKKLPIQNAQSIVFGRPFFSKCGSLQGIATLPNDAVSPVIVRYDEIKKFLCGIDKSGFIVSGFVTQLCHK